MALHDHGTPVELGQLCPAYNWQWQQCWSLFYAYKPLQFKPKRRGVGPVDPCLLGVVQSLISIFGVRPVCSSVISLPRLRSLKRMPACTCMAVSRQICATSQSGSTMPAMPVLTTLQRLPSPYLTSITGYEVQPKTFIFLELLNWLIPKPIAPGQRQIVQIHAEFLSSGTIPTS